MKWIKTGIAGNGRMSKTALLLMPICLLAVLSGCSRNSENSSGAADPRKKAVVPVTVGKAEKKSVPLRLEVVGNVQAYATVAVKAQVQGELMSVHFKEGQEVKKGDLLFRINPETFDAKLRQAEAALAKDKAQLDNALKQVTRYGTVVNKGYVAQEQFDTVKTSADMLRASVQADEAAVESARLDVKYCSIRSPMDGVTGGIRVHAGNIVKATDNDKPLVFINRIKPIYVGFSVPERYLTQIKKHMAQGSLRVTATISGESKVTVEGVLGYIENEVDAGTGTIRLVGLFPNEDKMLWPGQFVNVSLTLATQEGMTVIPSQAVQSGQAGPYVFVVKPDQTVEVRTVVPGRILEGEILVEQGISPGETVVTDGQLRLGAGSSVQILESPNGKEKEGAAK